MEPTTRRFDDNARAALADPTLQAALGNIATGFVPKRRRAIEQMPEWEALRDSAKSIKDHTLAHLDAYLERFESNVIAAGGQVHWARDAAEAREIVLSICRSVEARLVTKGKTMISEEIGLNQCLEGQGIEVVETDLGEYIIQLRREPPSHIIAPAIHLTKTQIEASFRAAHADLDSARDLDEPRRLVDEARNRLRPVYGRADVGITGANLLVAATGSSIIVTNEGNGDLTQALAKVHVVLASIEKLVPDFADAATILRLLARSATGQEFSTYTTVSTGPRRPGDLDGPEQYHVVLVDNGRSALLGTEFEDMLRCIRCAACLNHCPVYGAIGGHAYGWVYPGPMGSVLTPGLIGLEAAASLPDASTFCGRCDSVCPMKIPLTAMMRGWRGRAWRRKITAPRQRWAIRLWAWLARRPLLYRRMTSVLVALLRLAGGRRGVFSALPLAGGWTDHRDFPVPEGRTFQSAWRSGRHR
jgi:L-lactate dehydrogenase complex protein LldF